MRSVITEDFYLFFNVLSSGSNSVNPDKNVSLIRSQNHVVNLLTSSTFIMKNHYYLHVLFLHRCIEENLVIRKFRCFHFTCPFSCMCLCYANELESLEAGRVELHKEFFL